MDSICLERLADLHKNGQMSTTSPSTSSSNVLIPLHQHVPIGCYQSSEALPCLRGSNLSWTEVFSVANIQCRESAFDGGVVDALNRLLKARWLRVLANLADDRVVYRVYLLPDDVGRSSVSRHSKGRRLDLEILLSSINTSGKVWSLEDTALSSAFSPWAQEEDGSLFYIFNTLPSPRPDASSIQDRFARCSVEDLLDTFESFPGLKTSLYPYQARSAAAMIQQESTLQLRPDPRYEERLGPDGRPYYFVPRELLFARNAPQYESNRCGILAETMGLGKTLICFAVILATRHHLPKIPPQYQHRLEDRTMVPSLLELAIDTAGRNSIPAKAHLDHIRRELGIDHFAITKHIELNPTVYYIPGVAPRSNRRTQTPPARKMLLCSGTIIVVPRNLVHQWKSELRKHVQSGPNGLKVLVLDGSKAVMPPAEGLRHYDVVLFSKPTFEKEIRHGSDRFGRNTNNTFLECHCPYIGATRERDCHCLRSNEIYHSPIQDLHWLRIIIDEGHEFSSASSNAVLVAQKLVTADRRWIVSGTPARDRLYESSESLSIAQSGSLRQTALERRKKFNTQEELGSSGAAKSLGLLAGCFLQVRPWAAGPGEAKVEWDDFIYKHDEYRKRTYSSFSACLRRTLESLVIKTQPEDVERDIILPPLQHKIIRLKPSYYDKITANLFVLFLTSNAVCSERTDQDYLFHKNSSKPRYALITNLRQSNFFWTGFSAENISSAIETSMTYLAKDDIKCTDVDRSLLNSCIAFSNRVLDSTGWQAMSRYHELGVFLNSWPEGSKSRWTWNNSDPNMIGASQLIAAQNFVDHQLFDEEPLRGLESAGEIASIDLESSIEADRKATTKKDSHQVTKVGVPQSAMSSEPSAAKRHNTSSPKRVVSKSATKDDALKASKAKSSLPSDASELPEESSLRDTTLTGTVSAKLSYLIDRVLEFHETEKIIIFYDGDNAAFYLAQCLDLLHIKYLIYAKSLSNESKSRYVVSFDEDDSIRVLLMDIRSGAFGLNVNKASRVFFINPVCRPSAEAQAIKRAHRIGQTKPVFVETLILEGTIEEAIFERSQRMTQTEHMEASQLSDDQGISRIIKTVQALDLSEEEGLGTAQMAPLSKPVQIFGRKGRGSTKIKGIDRDSDPFNLDKPAKKAKGESKRKVPVATTTDEQDISMGPISEPSINLTGNSFTNSMLAQTAGSQSIFG
ncbi:hypothetical protein BT63DRAFT_374678 [Microthyrium microscopicum]|uniref:Helicase C-terminal domain-containing protein n=1 Tax=Microthyrium microscopicum TaxID=703497 RepID=A0A6A6UBV0_9PEZI|nr:hypothetical protein BT63DRAFT_374678 [Microthyrium microscopicum]